MRNLVCALVALSNVLVIGARASAQTQALSQAQGAPAGAGVTVDLRLDDAVRLALEHNLDIAVERLNPQTFDLSVAAARAAYRPTLTSVVGRNDVEQLPTSQLVGNQGVSNQTVTYNAGFLQALPWGGGSFSASWNNRRQASTSTFNTFNPQYNSTFSANFVQPLLRGFKTDAARTTLRVTAINRDISDIQLQSTVTNTLASVRNAYWDLVFATQAVDVAQRSLDLANKLIEDNKARVEVGTMAPIDIVQAEAEAATRRQTLAVAEATHQTAELALKRLIVGGTDDVLWRARINPIDRPTFKPEPVDLEAAVKNALSKRTDLAQNRRSLEINDLNLRLLHNSTLPAADLVASYGLQGIGGPRFIRSSGLGGAVLETIPGGYGNALTALTGRDYPNWNLQLQLSYPIGQSAADANYSRAKIQVQQTQAQLKALELQVATEVTNIGLQVESGLKRLEAAVAAREFAQKRLEAEASKFEVGMSTNFFVVQAQRDLADAENNELRALLDYRKAIVDFERVQLTSASRGGITVVSATTGATTPTARTTGTTGTTTGTTGTTGTGGTAGTGATTGTGTGGSGTGGGPPD